MIYRSTHKITKNNRTDINKPNEDFLICEDKIKLYIVADGVTRPHDEYNIISQDSLAGEITKKFCNNVRNLVEKYYNDLDEKNIEKYLKSIIVNSNNDLQDYYKHNFFPPSISFLLCLIYNDKMYFYNNCDTIGIILRKGAKIQFTTRYNYSVKKEKKYTKREIYKLLYNGDLSDSYPMINGDTRFNDYIYISSIAIEQNDKIVLSSDGLYEFLLSTNYNVLYNESIDEYFNRSLKYDNPPYNNYADDKSCIVVEVDAETSKSQ